MAFKTGFSININSYGGVLDFTNILACPLIDALFVIRPGYLFKLRASDGSLLLTKTLSYFVDSKFLLVCNDSQTVLYVADSAPLYTSDLTVVNSLWYFASNNWPRDGAIVFKSILVSAHNDAVGGSGFYIFPFPNGVQADTTTVGDIVRDIVKRVIPTTTPINNYIDVSELDAITCLGYLVAGASNARDAMSPLRLAYFFDTVESDGKVKFVRRNKNAALTIYEDDYVVQLGHDGSGNSIELNRTDETQLPLVVTINYLDADAYYQKGTQYARRLIGKSRDVHTIDVPIVLAAAEAAQIAQTILYHAWAQRVELTLTLPKKYAQIEPTDVVFLLKGSLIFTARFLNCSDDGYQARYTALVQNTEAIVQTVAGATVSAYAASPLENSATRFGLVDIAPLSSNSNALGIYAFGAPIDPSLSWGGAAILRSFDSGSSYVKTSQSISKAAIMGWAVTALGNWLGGNQIDTINTVDVALPNSTLSSITIDQLYIGLNLCVISGELLQFQTATLIATGTYRLSGLIRGKQGTEQFISTHAVGDRFLLIDYAAIVDVSVESTALNSALFFSAITFGDSAAPSSSNQLVAGYTGVRMKPLSPVGGFAVKRVSGDIDFAWVRRARVTNYWSDFTDVPLDETVESYRLDILSGTVVVRSITSAVTSCTYTNAQQVTDFGSSQTSLQTKLYQLSSIVGDGYVAPIVL